MQTFEWYKKGEGYFTTRAHDLKAALALAEPGWELLGAPCLHCQYRACTCTETLSPGAISPPISGRTMDFR